jgi:hypothetical protein
MPYPSTIYAYKYIFSGFKHAFEDKGYQFVAYTPEDDLKSFLGKYNPQIFMTASHFFYRKSLDFDVLQEYRNKGMVLLTKIDYWNSPILKNRINEAPSMKDDRVVKDLIESKKLGDYYYCTAAQGDGRMEGFAQFAGQDYLTIPLAADSISLQATYEDKFSADVSFIGTNLPQKREFFSEWLFPLRNNYDLKLYGQDWTRFDRYVGMVAKGGQYFNLPIIKDIQKSKLQPGDEAKIYASSKILVNLHEDYQRKYGGDCNERTFKIPFCGGLEIMDDISSARDYFIEGKEIVIAKNKDDWFDKIKYYYDNPKEARLIAQAGQLRAQKDHTYHNRVDMIINLLR